METRAIEYKNLLLTAGSFDSRNAQLLWYSENKGKNRPKRPAMSTAFNAFVRSNQHRAGYSLLAIASPERFLQKTGDKLAESIKKSITGWSVPANAPSTIAKKGFNNPLIETGKMRDSIDYRINRK